MLSLKIIKLKKLMKKNGKTLDTAILKQSKYFAQRDIDTLIFELENFGKPTTESMSDLYFRLTKKDK